MVYNNSQKNIKHANFSSQMHYQDNPMTNRNTATHSKADISYFSPKGGNYGMPNQHSMSF